MTAGRHPQPCTPCKLGPADDRRQRNFVVCFSERRKKKRVWERKRLATSPGRRLADDGKRLFYSEGRCIGTRSENRVRVRGRLHAGFLSDRKSADSSLSSFRRLFLLPFLEGARDEFFSFSLFSGSLVWAIFVGNSVHPTNSSVFK